MREINLNGYIDDEEFWGDEITPGCLKNQLYGENVSEPLNDDVRIVLNSYGGNCNAATQMFDIIKGYPGHVELVISGTAASAATVFAQAADVLKMTPGSLFMIHDPLTVAMGNEADLRDTIHLLQTVKTSIINMYATRCTLPRDKIASMMTKTTWLDANEAKEYGFIDAIEGDGTQVLNAVQQDRGEAEQKVQAWLDRHRPVVKGQKPKDAVPEVIPEAEESPAPETQDETRVSAVDLQKRLQALKYNL